MSYRAKLRHLPIVLKRLRQRAGYKTQRGAARAIRRKAGGSFSYAGLSRWERGQEKPTLESLVSFLDGLGYDLKALQDELDRVDGEPVAEPGATRTGSEDDAALARHLEQIEGRLRALEKPPSRED